MPRTEFWLRPLEPLFFGPPRSLLAGEAHHASSTFPPSPWTLQGIVRTHLLKAARPNLDHRLADRSPPARREREALVGSPVALPAGWRLGPPLPVEERDEDDEPRLQAWFPVPRFLFRRSDRADGPPVPAQVLIDGVSDSGWDLADDRIAAWEDRNHAVVVGPPPDADAPTPMRGWIDASNLRWALTGQGAWSPDGHADDLPPFVRRERQVGVAIDDKTGTARDRMLYTMERLRFRERSGMWSSLDVDRVPAGLQPDRLRSGIAHAGRRARPVQLAPAPEKSRDWQALERPGEWLTGLAGEESEGKARVWLFLASPVYLPADQDRPRLIPVGGVVDVRVRAAFVGQPELHGGFSMASGASRANRMLVPAGSVWLLDIEGGQPADRARVLRTLHGGYPLADPWNDPDAEADAAFGFGRTFVGIGPCGRCRSAFAAVRQE